jgi:hypothetical protein
LLFQIIAAHIIANFLPALLAEYPAGRSSLAKSFLHGHHVQDGKRLAPLNYRPELAVYRDTIDVETNGVEKPFPRPNDLNRKYRIKLFLFEFL